ncbi:Druantia anti-phage system protein DruA [Paraburkholderia sp. J67]|uniref:Druantia anti-phage system protein DruA n=1 Tax=Paraburkholderia sp. J67 TaxID=2805435 RepID=UPI002ABD3A86|nr:Druantia anti-phage system protein DruA [Paraburkholderia sp. J67]
MAKIPSKKVVHVSTREALLKRRLRRHLSNLGFRRKEGGRLEAPGTSKEIIRHLHAQQRKELLHGESEFIKQQTPRLLKFFASGSDINPERISPRLERVASGTWQGELFRLASLTWSVPVSRGFGRRLRYLVWDDSNGKLIGIFAIGDPVFNLSARDNHIGWDGAARTERLVNVMDAYVLGALPPYNALLGGKLVACLIRSREIYDDFASVYGDSCGIISGKKKQARLLAVTTSSSMGRSSVYNRLKLDSLRYFTSLGYSGGWGHFHIPEALFSDLREYLLDIDHPCANTHEYGDGPNWRIRTIRAAMSTLGFKGDVLKHGIQREVFISDLAVNASSILRTGRGRPQLASLRPVSEIASLAIERWVIQRAVSRPEYQEWSSAMLPELIKYSYTARHLTNDQRAA